MVRQAEGSLRPGVPVAASGIGSYDSGISHIYLIFISMTFRLSIDCNALTDSFNFADVEYALKTRHCEHVPCRYPTSALKLLQLAPYGGI